MSLRDRHPASPIMALIGLRAAAGSVLLLDPRRVLEALPDPRDDRVIRNAARVIGARDLIEAGLLLQRPTRAWVLVGAGIDATHAATMFSLAAARPGVRGPARASALGALGMAGAGILVARRLGQKYESPLPGPRVPT